MPANFLVKNSRYHRFMYHVLKKTCVVSLEGHSRIPETQTSNFSRLAKHLYQREKKLFTLNRFTRSSVH